MALFEGAVLWNRSLFGLEKQRMAGAVVLFSTGERMDLLESLFSVFEDAGSFFRWVLPIIFSESGFIWALTDTSRATPFRGWPSFG